MRRFWPHLRPIRAQLALGILASAAWAVAQIASPWPLKVVFDSVLSHHRLPAALSFLPTSRFALLNASAGAMIVIASLRGVFSYLATGSVGRAGQRLVFDVRCRLFRHLEAQSLGFHQTREAGDLMARLSGDAQALQGVMVNAAPTVVNSGITLVGMFTIMALINWRYALLSVSLLPVVFLVVRFYLTRLRQAQRQARRFEGNANSVAQEVLTSLAVVQAFGQEETEARRFAGAAGSSLVVSQRAVGLQAQFAPLMTFAMTGSTALIVWLGARAVIAHQLTAGELLVFMSYLKSMYSPVRQLAKLAGVVTRGQAAAERIGEVLDVNEQVPEAPDPIVVREPRGSISLRGVEFAYPGKPLALEGVDLEIPSGAHFGLVGATGSGKSTLLRLLIRFIDPTAGAVLLDGVDLRQLELESLRRQVALVPQEPYIFKGTLWENITYGSVSPSPAAALAAARATGVDAVLGALPQGYETLVAERGGSLSGGQRQCVAIARAMARDPRVLLLDEPITGLDVEAQSVVVDALSRVAKGRTTITVSHQLDSLVEVDRIVVIEHGRIAEIGTRSELLSARRAYWRFHSASSKGRHPQPNKAQGALKVAGDA